MNGNKIRTVEQLAPRVHNKRGKSIERMYAESHVFGMPIIATPLLPMMLVYTITYLEIVVRKLAFQVSDFACIQRRVRACSILSSLFLLCTFVNTALRKQLFI